MEIGKYIDETVATWQEQRPDLDFMPMSYMLRFHAMAQAAMTKIEIITKSHGLTVGEFDVLATLRRHGATSTLTPSFIAEVAMVSPSGLTHRLTQLEKSGHIIRIADDSDRRSSLVSITKSGAAVADQIIAQIAEQSARMYDAIPAKDLEKFSKVVALVSAQLESEVVNS
jgi:DNA-binding MarR family transcriptional regulator